MFCFGLQSIARFTNTNTSYFKVCRTNQIPIGDVSLLYQFDFNSIPSITIELKQK